MHVRHTPEFALGYYRYNSHDVLPVESCPISSPLINQAIAAVWALGREKAVPESLHGVQFFANHDDTQLLVEAYVRPGDDPEELQPLAAALAQRRCQRWWESSFSRSLPSKTRAANAPRLPPLIPKLPLPSAVIRLCTTLSGQQFRVSGGSFFQTNRYLVDTLAQVVTADRGGRAALDLYAGVGLFTLPLARKFDQVLAVESSPEFVRRSAPQRSRQREMHSCDHRTLSRSSAVPSWRPTSS